MNEPNFSILIAEDIVPTQSYEELFVKCKMSSSLGNSLYNTFQKADFSSVNLECPFTISDTHIEKNEYHLRAFPKTIKKIKTFDPKVVGLADYHILYYGENGLADDLSLLSENGIPYLGVGSCLSEVLQTNNLLVKNSEGAFKIVDCSTESIND